MKKTILIFFILNTLLFSSSEFITSNGKISFKYNEKYNQMTRFNGDMGNLIIDIDNIEYIIKEKTIFYQIILFLKILLLKQIYLRLLQNFHMEI